MNKKNVISTLNELSEECYESSKKKGWHDPEVDATFVERLCLVHSEISEALEEYRDGRDFNEVWYSKDKQGNDKPEGVGVELADAVIRIFDICGKHGINLGHALVEKIAYNETRPYRHGGKKV